MNNLRGNQSRPFLPLTLGISASSASIEFLFSAGLPFFQIFLLISGIPPKVSNDRLLRWSLTINSL